MRKSKEKYLKIIGIMLLIIIIAIILMVTVIGVKNGLNNKEYLSTTENANSNLIAKYIQSGITIGGITGTLDVLDTSDATATSKDILNGKTAYARGEKITGEYVETANIIDLGIGTSFNVTSYSNYQNFTVDNFLCEPIDDSYYEHGGDFEQGRWSAGINFSKSYNATKGIFNVSLVALVYSNETGGGISGIYDDYPYDAHVYLVY